MSVTLKQTVYFGYGSNLWIDRRSNAAQTASTQAVNTQASTSFVIGYANIIPAPGEVVYGGLYEIAKDDESRLDDVRLRRRSRILREAAPGVTGVPWLADQWTESHDKCQPEYIPRMTNAIADAIREGIPEDYIEKYMRKVIPKA
ncbi:hypothetical protein BD626DRAFT_630738 [Schizophyllum amplum]|uniref:Gamma-glutamylcyclotransferase n=1 Tax=Schizophyllum amplum TaxID=97359 RepID=A0A550CCP8_9AGAR|nr:hypothetical protein BD626DRAFT_630738 [Auriculariopsis ampla]